MVSRGRPNCVQRSSQWCPEVVPIVCYCIFYFQNVFIIIITRYLFLFIFIGLIDAEEVKMYMKDRGIKVSDEHVHQLLKKFV